MPLPMSQDDGPHERFDTTYDDNAAALLCYVASYSIFITGHESIL